MAHHGDPGETPYVGTWSYDTQSADIAIEIVNSIFYENSSGGLFVPDGVTVSIRNSIFEGSSDDNLLVVGDGETFTLGDLQALEQAGFGTGNSVADPGFADPGQRDFSTDDASPARDAGEEIPGLEVDVTGGPRAEGSAPDIGPVEG